MQEKKGYEKQKNKSKI